MKRYESSYPESPNDPSKIAFALSDNEDGEIDIRVWWDRTWWYLGVIRPDGLYLSPNLPDGIPLPLDGLNRVQLVPGNPYADDGDADDC